MKNNIKLFFDLINLGIIEGLAERNPSPPINYWNVLYVPSWGLREFIGFILWTLISEKLEKVTEKIKEERREKSS